MPFHRLNSKAGVRCIKWQHRQCSPIQHASQFRLLAALCCLSPRRMHTCSTAAHGRAHPGWCPLPQPPAPSRAGPGTLEAVQRTAWRQPSTAPAVCAGPVQQSPRPAAPAGTAHPAGGIPRVRDALIAGRGAEHVLCRWLRLMQVASVGLHLNVPAVLAQHPDEGRTRLGLLYILPTKHAGS